MQRNLHVFEDESVALTPVGLPGLPRGLQLAGLDPGEASAQLLGALGFANGDVVTHVDGAAIASPDTIESLLLDVPITSSWTLTLHRRTGSTWRSLDRTIVRAP